MTVRRQSVGGAFPNRLSAFLRNTNDPTRGDLVMGDFRFLGVLTRYTGCFPINHPILPIRAFAIWMSVSAWLSFVNRLPIEFAYARISSL